MNFELDFLQFLLIKSKGFTADLQVLINQPKEHWGKDSNLYLCSRSKAGLVIIKKSVTSPIVINMPTIPENYGLVKQRILLANVLNI